MGASAAAQAPATASECGPWELLAPLPQSRALSGVAAGGGELVAVGDGVALYSHDAITWIVTELPGVTLNAVAGDGTRWVAVGPAGTILRSFNGRVWEPAASPTARDLESVAWGDAGWVATGDEVRLHSVDGDTWSHGEGGPYSYDLVAWTGDAYVTWRSLKACCPGPEFERSADGMQWTPLTATFGPGFAGAGLTQCGGRLVAVYDDGAWDVGGAEAVKLGDLPQRATAVTCVDGVLVAVGGYIGVMGPQNQHVVMSSLNGANWSTDAAWSASGALRAVAPDATRVVAVGDYGRIVVSREGQPWEVSSSAVRPLLDVATDGTAFLAASADPGCRALDSADGRAWDCVASGVNGFSAVFRADSLFFAQELGTGKLFSSSTGLTWTELPWIPPAPNHPARPLEAWAGARWNGTWLLGGGDSRVCMFPDCPRPYGFTATSEDLVTWNSHLAVGRARRSLAEHGARLVSNHGSGLGWSDDGVTWNAATIPPNPAFPGLFSAHTLVVWTGDRFVAAGGRRVLASSDGTAWTDIGVLPAELVDLAWSGRELVAVGLVGGASVVMESADGTAWSVFDPEVPSIWCSAGQTRHFPYECGLLAVAATRTVQVAVGGAGALLRRECASRTGPVRRHLGRATARH